MKTKLKRVKAMITAVCILAGIISGISAKPQTAYAMTTQSAAVQWARSQAGKIIDVDGNGAWCVDLIHAYCDYLGAGKIWGNANVYPSAQTPSGFTKIQGATIQPGDVAIWTGGTYGHVAIVLSSNEIIDEAGSGYPEKCTIRKMYYTNGYWGVLRPNFNPETVTVPPVVSEGQMVGVDSDGYMLQCKVTGESISSVKVASWIDGNGQVDLKWNDMVRQADGITYKCYISYAEHGGIVGNYQNHIYAYNPAGSGVQSVYINSDNLTSPQVSKGEVIGADSSGYMLQCKVTGKSISSVKVASWVDGNGQVDLKWNDMVCQADGETYKCYISYAEHGDIVGNYQNHIYAYSSIGEGVQSVFFSVNDKPTISNLHILDIDTEGYVIECTVESYHLLTSVYATVRAIENGTDNLQLINMECQPDGLTYRCYVPYSNHNYERGLYENLIYAKSITGEESQLLTYYNEEEETEKVEIESIQLERKELTMRVGSQETLKVVFNPENATNKTLTWKSSSPSIAEVDDDGKITAKTPGKTVIIATTPNGKTESCQVTVTKEEQPLPHMHSYGTAWKSNDEKHWRECGCGDRSEEAEHKFSWIIDRVATIENSGVKHEECEICGCRRNEETIIEKLSATHMHNYGTMWKTNTEGHWRECECGDRSEETEHKFSWIIDRAATIENSGIKHEECEICGRKKNEGTLIEKLSTCQHLYQVSLLPATIKKDGSITEVCSKCGNEKGKTTVSAVDSVILSCVSYTYNGKVQQPNVTVKDSAGKILNIKTDYTISFSKGMKNVGCYTVIVTLKGNYTGTIDKTFDIVPKGTTITKITAKKNGFSVKWKKRSSQTTGYEIAYSSSSRFSKKNTKTLSVKKNKSTSKSISKLRTKKKYYVRIRTYKTVKINEKSTRIYSAWSKVKTVKTKNGY